MKRIVALMMSLMLLTGSNLTVFATPEEGTFVDDEIIEEYQYTANVTSSLSISGKKASCVSIVHGFSGLATKVVITQTLQKQNGSTWTYVSSWNKTFNTWLGSLSNSKSSLSSGTYRLKTVAKVYSGNNYETITVYSSTASC